jgi:hypothetical protein
MAAPLDKTQLTRWRLILGQHANDSLAQMAGGPGGCQLSAEQAAMDEALAAIYDETAEGRPGQRRVWPSGWATSAPTSKRTSSPSSKMTPSKRKS